MGDVIGQYGVEARYERYLQGERGSQAVIVNAGGNKIGEAYSHLALPGSDVVLTIDRRLQEVADRALTGKKGAVVAMDPNTGDILAMASAPRFAPSIFTTEVSKETWADLVDTKGSKLNNRVTQGVFPPGSVFKIFVAAAALSEGVVTPQERFFCPGYTMFGTRKFRCHKHSGHGSVDLFESIVQSCDVYFYTVGQRLGVDRIYQYAHDLFEFGEPTGLGIGDESSGLIPSTAWKAKYFRNPEDKKWYPGETLPVSIGQGAITTTPLQIVRGLSAVVNGGLVLKPRIVRKVVASDGRVLEETPAAPEIVRKLDLDPQILEKLNTSMVGVVDDKRGTGHRAALPEIHGISVGGKTGTAQVASRESGIKDEDHAWFAGYAPADHPKIVVAALVENGGHGGAEAAPIAQDVLAAYFGIPDPPPEEKNAPKKMPTPAPEVNRE
jgi:penicillin-binding protein 2